MIFPHCSVQLQCCTGSRAVSYTHLDVYKRQMLDRPVSVVFILDGSENRLVTLFPRSELSPLCPANKPRGSISVCETKLLLEIDCNSVLSESVMINFFNFSNCSTVLMQRSYNPRFHK